jgi:ABC-type sugar transport system permease subunit
MSLSDTIAALGRILLFYAVIVGLLFLELTILARTVVATRGQKSLARYTAFLAGGLTAIAAVVFVFAPGLAIIPAAGAILLSLLLGLFSRRGSFSLSEQELALLFIIPAALGIFLFYYYQIGQTAIFSLNHLDHRTDWSWDTFVGLGNYLDVITSSNFLGALYFTIYFTVVAVFIEFWVGLGMAMSAFWVNHRLRGFVRSIIVIPWAIPPIISANIWKWLYNGDVGVGYILKQVGLVKEAPVFLADPTLAVYSVILADVWKMSSMMAILLIGGLAIIPQEIYDAAKVDGARGFYRFRRITLPMLAPTILVALLFRCMDALRTFDLIYGLTNGGPGTSTETLSSFTYKFYFTSVQFGLGSAYGMVVFVMIMFLSVFYIQRIRKSLRFKE